MKTGGKKYDSLIQAISLAGSELFHSNVWKWLLDSDVGLDFAKLFFPEIAKINRVEREEGHRDITIWGMADGDTTKVWVIENKFKSYARKDQLEKYESVLKNGNADDFGGGVLTGVMKPYWIGELNGSWRFVTYKDIVTKVEKLLKAQNKFEEEEVVILKEYCRFTRALLKKIHAVSTKYDGKLTQASDFKNEDFGGLFQKIVANNFANKLSSALMTELKPLKCATQYRLSIAPEFLHGDSLVYVYFKKPDNNGNCEKCDRLIGIEMQSGQYRYCAEVKSRKDVDSVYKKLVDGGWFAQRNTEGCTKKKKDYRQFGSFIYRYKSLPQDFDHILRSIKKDMKSAGKLLNVLDAI